MVFSCETLIIESKYPGWLYTGISRVDSICNGDIEISSLYFVPKNAEGHRFINVCTKQRLDGVFKRVKERDDWITYLQICMKTVTFSDDHKDTLLHWAENVQIHCETLDDYTGGLIGSHSKKTSSSPVFGVEVSTIMTQ